MLSKEKVKHQQINHPITRLTMLVIFNLGLQNVQN